MLVDKGREHERAVLERYRAEGLSVYEVPEQDKVNGETFQQWVDRVGDVLNQRHDVVFQMPFVHEGIRGIADFLRRVDDADGDGFTWEPIDAKLARNAAKPGHVLQLCFYAEAIEAATGRLPELMRIELGSGEPEPVRVADVLAYWRRMRGQLAKLLTDDAPTDTVPEPCDHCQFCDFEQVCEADWRAADSLVHVAGVRAADRVILHDDRSGDDRRTRRTRPRGRRPRSGPPGDLRASGPPAGRGPQRSRREAAVRVARPTVARRPRTARRRRRPTGSDRLRCAPGPRRRRRVPRLRGPPVLARRRRAVLPVRSHREVTERRLGVRGVLGARQGRRGRRDAGADRSSRGSSTAVPRHARVPLQPHRTVVVGAAGEGAQRRRTRRSNR